MERGSASAHVEQWRTEQERRIKVTWSARDRRAAETHLGLSSTGGAKHINEQSRRRVILQEAGLGLLLRNTVLS